MKTYQTQPRKAAIQRKFQQWIDFSVIADAIFDGLEENEKPLTLENAKSVWFSVLENLQTLVKEAILYQE